MVGNQAASDSGDPSPACFLIPGAMPLGKPSQKLLTLKREEMVGFRAKVCRIFPKSVNAHL